MITFPRKVYLCAFTIITLCALFFTSGKIEQQLWVTSLEVEHLRWDTGYGFNPWQSEEKFSDQGKIFTEAGVPLFLIKKFPGPVFLSGLEICPKEGGLRAFLVEKGERREVRPESIDASGCLRIPTSELRKPAGKRNWTRFFLGAVAVTTLVFSWFYFFLHCLSVGLPDRSARIFFSALGIIALSGCAFAAWAFYPGFINPYDPIGILSGKIGLSYSSPLQIFWLSIYEISPNGSNPLFAICLTQLLMFSIAVLYYLLHLYSLFKSRLLLAGAAVTLLFNPVSLAGQFFLARGIVSGCANFLLWAWAFLLVVQRKPSLRGKTGIFFCLALLCLVLRLDNAPFLVLIMALILATSMEWRRCLLVTISLAFLYGMLTVAEKRSIQDEWRPRYVNSQANYLLASLAEEPFASNKNCSIMAPGQTKGQVMKAFLCVKENLGPFLENRLQMLHKLVVACGIWFKESTFISEQGEFSSTSALLADFGIINPHLNKKQELRYRPYSFTEFYEGKFVWVLRLALPVLLIILSIFATPFAPGAAFVSLIVFLRFLSLLAATPGPNFHYFFDIHLWGIFVPFAMALEWRGRRVKRRREAIG